MRRAIDGSQKFAGTSMRAELARSSRRSWASYPRGGKLVWLEATLTVWTEASGEFIAAFFRDQSASEERFRTTFEHMPVAMAHVALDGWIERANRRFCRMMGRTEVELRGLKIQSCSTSKSTR